ncbi:hypothetical protein [Scandinavium goeteborgense]|uniref:hypothetical protein n=1 Tax=Scandinavium goeteborgense TaxID=1851514 RepID=UPI000F678724|nr:hypothetical protein [Scandinavium goeteborgense]QKN81392.1 hypothetical protein A8O29_008925 [Scandinavium goeteborgense]
MFTLYMKSDARMALAPQDIQFILTPDSAMELACIFYELDYRNYRRSIIPQQVPDRKHGVSHRFSAQPYKRKRRPFSDNVYDDVRMFLDIGWMVGVDTLEDWDRFRNPFYFDKDSNLVYDCFMDHYGESFRNEVRSLYEDTLNAHQGRKPEPTIKQHYSDAPIQQAQAGKAINSKAAGRLLAAGGIYNGNIEGFHEAAQQLGGDSLAGYDQVMDNKGVLIAGASVAAGLMMGRMKIPALEELEHFGARGASSGRPFDPELAGGAIKNLTTDGVDITHEGIATVEKHISRFDPDPGNEFMVDRLKKIVNGEMLPEQVDLNFYTHECREYQRYCNVGWVTGRPIDDDEAYILWNNTHTATLEDYKLEGKTKDLYHPDAPLW